jgi:hypothetical protein
MARVVGSCDRCLQAGSGWALSSQRMMTKGQFFCIAIPQ